MDPIRLVVALVALLGVGAFAFLAANSEREVDAGSAIGFVDESVADAESIAEVDPTSDPAQPLATTATEPMTSAFAADAGAEGQPSFPDPADKVDLTEEQWKERLTPEEFNVLREAGTERAFTSPLNDIQEPGWFVCAGCGNLLYETETKFESGTGWPSFWEPVAARYVIEEDEGGFMNRTEIRCARCDSHLGHVFNDGPRDKTGLRYCMNGVAMKFLPRPDSE